MNGKIKNKRYYGIRSRNILNYINEDIIFTTYGILGKEDGSDRNKHVLHCIYWHRIILDESHLIRNAKNNTSKHIANLKGKNKWLLSGTPWNKYISDIENQLKFIGMEQDDINYLDLKSINKAFDGGSWFSNKIKPLINILPKIMMRHKKEQKFNGKDIVKMSGKCEEIIYIDFTPKQREYYDKLYNIAQEKYNYYKSIDNVGRGTLQILSSLLPARQACSGRIYKKEEIEQELSDAQTRSFRIQQIVNNSSNLNLSRAALFEMAEEEAFDDRDGECPICYECPFDEPLQTPCRHIFCRECIIPILEDKKECPMCRAIVNVKQLKQPKSNKHNQSDDINDIDNTNDTEKEIKFDSKMNRLIEEINKINREKPNDKILIFTSFSKSLTWICDELKKNNFQYRTLTGSMSMNKRKKQLSEFSDDSNVKVFVLTGIIFTF